ncbi:hypothetical protein RCDURKIN_115 [Rhodobacter phage RcDurkin]|nr:hypothetical protein RCDURKIN_115 [Rhodobacter phage RcDurkin]QXN72584.1 hypothetical protein RCTIPTONUS_114 [Rhodobacter phage RcTiptonus]UUV44485.1 hypothetical protein RCMENCHIE_116 [Rhodobacter phage RcMenchie]
MLKSRTVLTTRWPDGAAVWTEGIIGPDHDPYGFTAVVIRRHGRMFRITACSLRGLSLTETMKDHSTITHMSCGGGDTPTEKDEKTIIEYTGYGANYWLDILPRRISYHREKNMYRRH